MPRAQLGGGWSALIEKKIPYYPRESVYCICMYIRHTDIATKNLYSTYAILYNADLIVSEFRLWDRT